MLHVKRSLLVPQGQKEMFFLLTHWSTISCVQTLIKATAIELIIVGLLLCVTFSCSHQYFLLTLRLLFYQLPAIFTSRPRYQTWGLPLPYRLNSRHGSYPPPLLLTYSGYHWRPVKTSSLMILPLLLPVVLTSSGGHQKWAVRILLECCLV